QKLAQLCKEADANLSRAVAAESKVNTLERMLHERNQEITSLTNQLVELDTELTTAKTKSGDAKSEEAEGHRRSMEGEHARRKYLWVQDELNLAETNLKHTNEKFGRIPEKADKFERQVDGLKRQRDIWKEKHEVPDFPSRSNHTLS
ncbi:tropomyosin, partial [Flagelloscypha sp. PMI_526]